MKTDPRIEEIHTTINQLMGSMSYLNYLVMEELGVPFSDISCDALQTLRSYTEESDKILKPILEEIECKLTK